MVSDRVLRDRDAVGDHAPSVHAARLRLQPLGGVPERSNGAVSKTVRGASLSRVQIPPPPLITALFSSRLSSSWRALKNASEKVG